MSFDPLYLGTCHQPLKLQKTQGTCLLPAYNWIHGKNSRITELRGSMSPLRIKDKET